MKDSQPFSQSLDNSFKYIKANNERFSTSSWWDIVRG